ncbi:Predicted dithiol-disulfide isomerase, DsbA family [Thalassobacillus cyri]|uniref:Predicted dithiol-disulfide isomerase, DsbA family n=1 Tax=Thalassobacillus cyri TaxID=571932 RepID=A0A1H4HGE3_9BACI|nr:DsbA family oxidoreductase [Thalassobacillus cyri]SEB20923.1 Predicted dithiol-disulfide isomerase, DsbA family [Thalassobacillus cyri]
MKIEVWSDFVCPFCYIGKRRLEQALETFAHKEDVELIFKSYELQPQLPSDENVSVYEVLANKMGTTVEQAKAMNNQLVETAKTVGLDYNFDHAKQTNTLDAHRLFKYAEKQGKGLVFTERLLRAYFTESRFLGRPATLIELAEEVGLDGEEAEEVLVGDDFLEDVRNDQREAQQIGVQGVPFFVFNRKYAISGAQPPELFQETLEKVWKEENETPSLQQVQTSTDAACTDDSCNVPEDHNKA